MFGAFKKSVESKIMPGKPGLRQTIIAIKKQLADYLETINNNTNEIQSNYEFCLDMNSKIDKLAERIDELSMFIRQQKMPFEEEKHEYSIVPLTTTEQDVFMGIYTLCESKPQGVTYMDVSRRTGLTDSLVRSYVTNLTEKGVPLLKRYLNHEVYLCIDPHFKEIQAKENLLNISMVVVQKFCRN